MSKPVTVPIAAQFHEVTVEYIDRAAEVKGLSRSDFIREAVLTAAKRATGKDAPEVPPILRGRQDSITLAAQAAGLTRDAYLKQVALRALGEDPKAKRRRAR